MINKLKKQQSKYINDEERELLDGLTENSSFCKQIAQLQEDAIYKAMLFALKNKNRAARLLVIKGMMSMDDYISCKW